MFPENTGFLEKYLYSSQDKIKQYLWKLNYRTVEGKILC